MIFLNNPLPIGSGLFRFGMLLVMSSVLFDVIEEWSDENGEGRFVRGVLNADGRNFVALLKDQSRDLGLATGQLIAFEVVESNEDGDFISAFDVVSTFPLDLPDALPKKAKRSPKSLIEAVKKSDTQKVTSLLRHGANPNSTDEMGNTTLMRAIANKDIPTVEVLVRYGADPHIYNEASVSAASLAQERVREFTILVNKAEEMCIVWAWINKHLRH